jgi:hypothetical protein
MEEGWTMSYWINVDRPTKRASIHRAGGCGSEQNKAETPLKGVGQLKTDGGWLQFPTEQEAAAYAERELAEPARQKGQKPWNLTRCRDCF